MSVASACVKGVCVCLLPRDDNYHRPYALRHGSLAFVSALLITIKVATLGLVALTPAEADLSTITVSRIVQLTNAERKKAGLNELKVNSKLAQAAGFKGEDMLENDYFAHISPSGVTPWFWMAKVGYTYQVAGENLAIDFTEAEDVVTAWLNSPSHKENMLRSDYTETGVAVVAGEFEGGTSTIVVHMFGKPTGSAAAAQTSATPTPTPAATVKPTPAPTKQPAATPAPTPTPTPALSSPSQAPTLPSDTTPPRVPRISAPDGSTTVQERVQLFLESESDATVHLTVNNEPQVNVPLSSAGKAIFALDLSAFEDGELAIRGWASDAAGNQSELSETLLLTKDTQAPDLARHELVFLISPVTELSDAAIFLPEATSVHVAVNQHSRELPISAGSWVHIPNVSDPLTISLTDSAGNTTLLPNIDIAPQFASAPDGSASTFQARFSALGRNVTASALVAVLLLLMLAVFVRIRIQHPDLITHATFVIALAAVLLLV